jgi:hypothetical protein
MVTTCHATPPCRIRAAVSVISVPGVAAESFPDGIAIPAIPSALACESAAVFVDSPFPEDLPVQAAAANRSASALEWIEYTDGMTGSVNEMGLRVRP